MSATTTKIPLTNSIENDIGTSFNQNSNTNTRVTSSSSSFFSSYLFLFFIVLVFAGLVIFFFKYYSHLLNGHEETTTTNSNDTTTATTSASSSGSIKNQILSFLPNFQSTPTPTSTFDPITTPPVNTLSPTSIPTSVVHEQRDNVLPTGTKEPQIDRPTPESTMYNDYNEDDSYSSIQQNKRTGKSGWCYIGEDRGFRSCSPVITSDTCMSGDIFPSKDMCVNPNLRWT